MGRCISISWIFTPSLFATVCKSSPSPEIAVTWKCLFRNSSCPFNKRFSDMETVAILNSLGFGEFIFHGVMNGLKYKFIYSYLFLTVYCRFFSSMVLLFLVDCFLFCFSLIYADCLRRFSRIIISIFFKRKDFISYLYFLRKQRKRINSLPSVCVFFYSFGFLADCFIFYF